MSVHLLRQIERLKKRILSLGAIVEESFEGAIRAVRERDPQLAQRIIAGDDRIDQMEIDVEEECLQTLALHQPVAFDLRFVVAVLKINSDLERIADLAVNIAEVAQYLADHPRIETPPYDLAAMTRKTQWMVKSSLDALVNIDPQLAQQVRAMDDEVDLMHRQNYTRIEQQILERIDRTGMLLHFLSISRYLERIADHAVNVSEDVIYMAQGDILRHERIHTIPKETAAR